MNAFQNPLIRIIASIAVGLLLILYPNAALPTILLIIGILSGLPSLYALLIYLLSEDRNKLPFPVLSLVILPGSIGWTIWLMARTASRPKYGKLLYRHAYMPERGNNLPVGLSEANTPANRRQK